jgi:thiamine-monophosphate kinase
MEAEFLTWLRERLPSHPALQLGIGDDAAILRLTQQAGCVVTSDMLNEGLDFHLDGTDWRLVGRKSLAVNLSDLAAMAAQPLAVIVSLTLPRTNALEIAKALYEGILQLADEFDVAIAGGDTGCWDGPLTISITALGQLTDRGPLLRGGAVPGDAVMVTGSFGGSILGRHLQFTPRVREALLLNREYELHAGTDVSDGLSLDLSHIATESDCGAILDLTAIPIDKDAQQLAQTDTDGRGALEHALGDGEDFELILGVPPDEAERLLDEQPLDVPIARIGTFVREKGLWTEDETGHRQPLEPCGYQH